MLLLPFSSETASSACSFLVSRMPQVFSGTGTTSVTEGGAAVGAGDSVHGWQWCPVRGAMVSPHPPLLSCFCASLQRKPSHSNCSPFLPIPSYSDLTASGMSSAQSSPPWPAFPIDFPMTGSVSSFSPDLNVPCYLAFLITLSKY